MAALKLALCYSGAGFSSNYYEIGGQQTALISGVGLSPTPHNPNEQMQRPRSLARVEPLDGRASAV